MRVLYHFRFSPFSRRVRLALAHKGLDVELREARENQAWMREAQERAPFRTFPVLIDDEQVLGDSTAILHWLDRAYPNAAPLWPAGRESARALQVVALVDVFLDNVINLGTRYFALRDHASWAGVRAELLGRASTAADALAETTASLGRNTIASGGWSAADMTLFTMVHWVESWPSRVKESPNVAQLVTLGFQLPTELTRWADAHRERSDVRAL